jgi:hypothetical protein
MVGTNHLYVFQLGNKSNVLKHEITFSNHSHMFIETEEASNASTELEEAPEDARTELEEEADAAMAGKEVADAAIETEEGASVDIETEETEDPDTKTEEAAPTPDVESVPKGSLNVSKGPQATEEGGKLQHERRAEIGERKI